MNPNKFSFKSEELKVDWISFKFQYFDESMKMEIANYFFKIGFNSYQESGKLIKPIKEPIFVNDKNKLEIIFIKEAPYWQGTIINFSGLNGFVFYAFVKKKLINLQLFSSGNLARLDIYYSRKNKKTDQISTKEFLVNCQTKLYEKTRNVNLQKNSKGLILKIGNRKSKNYSRIYEQKDSLKFEYEMKGNFLSEYSNLLFLNRFEELEKKLSFDFFLYFGKLLPLQFDYLDWLVLKLRPIRKEPLSLLGFKYHYVSKIEFFHEMDRKNFYTFLQFLVYIQTLEYEIDSLETTYYRKITFRVKDFLNYQEVSYNYYQLKSLLEFFHRVQSNSFIRFYSDTEYHSLVTIPKLKISKDKYRSWTISVWVVDELFYYKHPFIFPHLGKKLKKHGFEVQFELIKNFSSVNIEKIFYIKDFFKNYPSTLTNQKKTEIKQYFIELVKTLEQSKLIDSNYKIISNGQLCNTDILTTTNISEGFVIYEQLYL